ncbi:hypothetical protein [Pseudomonas benzopyrenica]|uniref:hypothetical protein n=1 Tax=Pseudomonas benzopyrenica TaxID=2993566 RepID=UPI003F161FC4
MTTTERYKHLRSIQRAAAHALRLLLELVHAYRLPRSYWASRRDDILATAADAEAELLAMVSGAAR